MRGGGAVTSDLTGKSTHLITSELRGDKCRTAMNMDGVFIVPPQWITRSVQTGRIEEENDAAAERAVALCA